MLDEVPNCKLSVREMEVMRLCCDGKTNNCIAQKLDISPRTVEAHKTHIFRKTGTNNTVELLCYAITHHLIDIKNK